MALFVHKTAGTLFYIGPIVNNIRNITGISDAGAMAYFEDISGGEWTEVLGIESFGELGDTNNTTTFTSVKDAREETFATTKSGSTLGLVVGNDPLDDGQIALAEAQKDQMNRAFKVVYADSDRGEGYSPTTDYFAGLVISKAKNLGGVQDITKRTFNIKCQTDVYEDTADPTGS